MNVVPIEGVLIKIKYFQQVAPVAHGRKRAWYHRLLPKRWWSIVTIQQSPAGTKTVVMPLREAKQAGLFDLTKRKARVRLSPAVWGQRKNDPTQLYMIGVQVDVL